MWFDRKDLLEKCLSFCLYLTSNSFSLTLLVKMGACDRDDHMSVYVLMRETPLFPMKLAMNAPVHVHNVPSLSSSLLWMLWLYVTRSNDRWWHILLKWNKGNSLTYKIAETVRKMIGCLYMSYMRRFYIIYRQSHVLAVDAFYVFFIHVHFQAICAFCIFNRNGGWSMKKK